MLQSAAMRRRRRSSFHLRRQSQPPLFDAYSPWRVTRRSRLQSELQHHTLQGNCMLAVSDLCDHIELLSD